MIQAHVVFQVSCDNYEMTYKSSNISPPKYTKSRSGFLALESGAASQALLRRSQELDGPLKYLELASQELRSWIPNLVFYGTQLLFVCFFFIYRHLDLMIPMLFLFNVLSSFWIGVRCLYAIYFRCLVFKFERTTHEIHICLSFCLGLMFFLIALFV